MIRRNMKQITLGLTLTATMVLGGCQTTTYTEDKQAAMERWTAARSGVLYSVALQEFEVGDLDKARRTLSQAMSQDPSNPRFHVLAGRISLERGELERAQLHLQDAISFDENNAEAHYLTGVIQQRWQQYESAHQSYLRAYEAKPDEVSGLLAAAEMLAKLGRTDEGIRLLSDKLVYFEHNAAIRVSIARIHLMEHRVGPAVDMLRDAFVLAPEDMGILEHLAMAEYAAGQWGEASYHLSRLLEDEDYEDRADLLKALADCYEAIGKADEARRIYIQLTEQDPADVDSWIKLGQAAWIVGDDGRLRRAAERTVALAPARYEGYLLRGMVLSRIDRLDAAINEFERATKLAPDEPTPLIMKGLVLEQAGRSDQAAQVYARAAEIAPNDARAAQLLANVSLQP
jgi:tetratricopeptide (TPR) repeat protein